MPLALLRMSVTYVPIKEDALENQRDFKKQLQERNKRKATRERREPCQKQCPLMRVNRGSCLEPDESHWLFEWNWRCCNTQ